MNTDVTIVIAVHKRLTYLRQAINSALAQTIPTQIIVAVDGVPSKEALQQVIGMDTNRVELVHFPNNVGQSSHLNRCLKLASTKWVSLLHDDDTLPPRSIELLLKAAQRFPNHAFYYGLQCTINDCHEILSRPQAKATGEIVEIDPRQMAIEGDICGSSGTLMDRFLTLQEGGFDPRLEVTVDWDIWTRLALLAGGVRINDFTVNYRQYFDLDRLTTQNCINGRLLLCQAVQKKRNIVRLKKCFPEYVSPVGPNNLIEKAAPGLLCLFGWKMTSKGRWITMAYASRLYYAKSYQTCWMQKAWVCFGCWLRVAYSVVRPIWKFIQVRLPACK